MSDNRARQSRAITDRDWFAAKAVQLRKSNTNLLAALRGTTEHLEAIETWMDANMPDESDGGNALSASINLRIQENRAVIASAEPSNGENSRGVERG